MNILLTGGLGYIGSHLALGLLKKQNVNLTIVDNLSNSKLTVKIKFDLFQVKILNLKN